VPCLVFTLAEQFIYVLLRIVRQPELAGAQFRSATEIHKAVTPCPQDEAQITDFALDYFNMAPFTCRVVDSHVVGVAGVHVMLDCRDQQHRAIARFESVTDEDGGISFWFPLPSIGEAGEIEPEVVDTLVVPRITLKFLPGNFHHTGVGGGPWLSIVTDLYLAGKSDHGVILHLEDSPRLEHTLYPVSGPVSLSMPTASLPPLAALSRSPSPLRLPPQVSADSDQGGLLHPKGENNRGTTRSRKRTLEREQLGRNTRAKFLEGGVEAIQL
jgi:hypothetical protein